jgi:predicted RNase H-like nuclease (RuvC/YqgF family)
VDFNINELAAAVIAITVTAGGFLAVLKVRPVRDAIAAAVGKNVDPLREAVSSLQSVVEAQGQSIDWLRSELDVARRELQLAREALQDNSALRQRVQELEEQVRVLEDELQRRRKYTRKDYRMKAEGPE